MNNAINVSIRSFSYNIEPHSSIAILAMDLQELDGRIWDFLLNLTFLVKILWLKGECSDENIDI